MIDNKILDHFCRCKNCGQKKENHKSKTNNCPVGTETRIGFTHFQKSCFFEHAKLSKKKENAINKMYEILDERLFDGSMILDEINSGMREFIGFDLNSEV